MDYQVITTNLDPIKAANENHPEFSGSDPIWVYAIGASEDGPIKVGISSNPYNRLRTLQIGSPNKLFLMFRAPFKDRATAYKQEKDIHACFDIIHGEWLDTPIEAVVDLLQDCCDTKMWEEIATKYWGCKR